MFLTAVRLGSFSNKHYMSPKQQEKWEKTLRGRYTKGLRKHHFLLFGVPFMAALYFGSVYLAEFTAIKFKMHDDRVQMMTEEEALSVGQNKRKVDMRDEYYRLQQLGDLDDWEQVRVPRFENEAQNVWDVAGEHAPDNSAAAAAAAEAAAAAASQTKK